MPCRTSPMFRCRSTLAPRVIRRSNLSMLRFERRITRGASVDLHLNIGDVRHGIDRELLVVEDAQGADAQRAEHHEPAMLDGEVNEFINHAEDAKDEGLDSDY